ncbi:hypothetical protein FKM82_020876 [Ascaphus truei]
METSKSSTMQVSFVCQRCSQPLKLDTSFKILDKVAMQELTAPLLTTAAVKPSDPHESNVIEVGTCAHPTRPLLSPCFL